MKLLKLLLVIPLLFFTKITYAQNEIGLDLSKQGEGRGLKLTGNDAVTMLGTIITNVIILLFSVGGIGFTIMILWGTIDWILSGGDKEKIAGARKRITTAIIGLALLSLTFVIMLVLGQVLGLSSLYSGKFKIPGLLQKN